MKTKDITKAKCHDLRVSGAAMCRAAELARQTAIRTGTNLIVVRDGKLARIRPQDLRSAAARNDRKSA